MGGSDFGRGGRVLKYSGHKRFRTRRACFEIVARAISGEESVFCRPWFMNYSAHVISAEEKALLDEVTNLPSMYNGPIDVCPT